MATYKEVLQKGKKLTRAVSKETSATELLILHFSQLEPTDLYLNFQDKMPKEKEEAFFKGLKLYLEDNIPVQQIIGYVYFYGYKLHVSNQALIPRFETEELVANVLMLYDEIFKDQDVDVVDVGTGSGCLAIALAKEEAHMQMIATDISPEALNLAKENAQRLNADIEFFQGDMLKPVLDKKFDILVSNPPYIPETEVVDDIIYDHEPHIALFGGHDGLKFIREIIEDSKLVLNQKAMIAFEHAYDKAEDIRRIARVAYPDAIIFTRQDMQKKDRMTFIIMGVDKETFSE